MDALVWGRRSAAGGEAEGGALGERKKCCSGSIESCSVEDALGMSRTGTSKTTAPLWLLLSTRCE